VAVVELAAFHCDRARDAALLAEEVADPPCGVVVAAGGKEKAGDPPRQRQPLVDAAVTGRETIAVLELDGKLATPIARVEAALSGFDRHQRVCVYAEAG